MTKPKRKEGYGSFERHAIQMTSAGTLLSYDEYTHLCTRQGELRKQIAEYNTIIHQSHIARNPVERNKFVQKRDALMPEYEQIEQTLALAEKVRRDAIKRRKAQLNGSEIAATLNSAKRIIESLHEQLGDESWTYEDRATCAELRRLISPNSPLLEIVHQDVVAKIQAEHAVELQEAYQAGERAISKLMSQLHELAQRRSVPARALRELYDSRYQELDPLRWDRGIRYRIHLTEADCVRIEHALDTIETGDTHD